MAQPVELVPLVCLRCATRIPARPTETAWVCSNCQQGMCLDEHAGLIPVPVFYQTGILSNQIGRPFWVAEGQVQVHRNTYSGNNDREAERFWSKPRFFFVPAYFLPLENLLEIGVKMLRRPPALQSGPAVRFGSPVLARSDVTAVAEFIVLAVEAERKDKLKEVNLSLQLAEPVLWILS